MVVNILYTQGLTVWPCNLPTFVFAMSFAWMHEFCLLQSGNQFCWFRVAVGNAELDRWGPG